ncbi:hypothetical protein CBS63078_9259 [Aspergillus niger]|nr:hypothetical protein CBS11350_9144 [Aspergillus niger]KAI2865339.1 hypothetical protein CBS13152_11088 [Aspergillus niger]KAI2892910.1 hypothetical protein CBS63078_9259 [Aspergillus niger]KAI2910629.1 hypothetical protein CBS147371_8697 [Aspergillus niger]KAI2930554.1 hypothetical protein CBS147320_3256 [Aspergillus niger]
MESTRLVSRLQRMYSRVGIYTSPRSGTQPSSRARLPLPSQRVSFFPPRQAACFSTTKPPACANTDSDRFTSALHQNKDWAAQISKEDPSLFPTLANGQQPEILWIGCSDSRCPETTLLGLKPGDVFVHRNIANVLHAGDLSSSAVIEYAVRYLRVNHVVLCGHTSCGGVAAALGNKQLGILDPWLLPLRQLRAKNLDLLNSLPADQANLKLVELNVLEGVKLLKEKSVVLEAIQERGLQVHGLIYDVGSGVLRELDTDESEEAIKARLTSFKTDV